MPIFAGSDYDGLMVTRPPAFKLLLLALAFVAVSLACKLGPWFGLGFLDEKGVEEFALDPSPSLSEGRGGVEGPDLTGETLKRPSSAEEQTRQKMRDARNAAVGEVHWPRACGPLFGGRNDAVGEMCGVAGDKPYPFDSWYIGDAQEEI